MTDLTTLRPMSGSDADLAAFATCFTRNGSPRTFEAVDWQYRKNPVGRLFVDVAATPEGFGGIYATLPFFARVDGRIELALQSLDTLTASEFRGKGLFVRLAQETFTRATREGASFIYGFPNKHSAHGFFNKLGWTELAPVPFLARPLHTQFAARVLPPYLRRFVPRWPLVRRTTHADAFSVERVARFDDHFTALWRAFYDMGVRVAVERDARYLNWRLVDKPSENYVSLAVFDGKRPVALVSYCVKDKHGGRIGYVMELLFVPGHADAARHLLRHTLGAMRQDRADVALAWCFAHSPPFSTYARCGFLPFPRKLRPIELHFGARRLAAASGVIAAKDWYLSYLDSDTV